MVLTSCATASPSSDTSGSASPSSTAAKSSAPFTVALGGVGVFNSLPFIAQLKGYAKDEGVDIKIKIAGSEVINDVLSGQADVAVNGATAALFPVTSGKETSLIYAQDTLASFTYFAASKSSVKSLTDCTTVSAGSAGTPPFLMANLMKQKANAKYRVVGYNLPTAQLAAVLSGSADCTAGTLSFLKPSLDAGKVHLVVSPEKEGTIPSGVPTTGPGIAVWGLTQHLQERQDVVKGFVKSLAEAQKFFESSSDEDVAKLLRTDDHYASIPMPQLTSQVTTERPFLTKPAGNIPEDSWNDFLDLAKISLTGVNSSDKKWQYQTRVDMTYVKAAAGSGSE
jgi:ABC-type nitrate/sulfonate/bicarbonate transport system substrate-binding protein